MTLPLQDWVNLLNPVNCPKWIEETVENEVRYFLASCEPWESHTTGALVGTLFPIEAKKELKDHQRRLYSVLMKLAKTTLKDCATQGEPRLRKNSKTVMVKPWIWHKPHDYKGNP